MKHHRRKSDNGGAGEQARKRLLGRSGQLSQWIKSEAARKWKGWIEHAPEQAGLVTGGRVQLAPLPAAL